MDDQGWSSQQHQLLQNHFFDQAADSMQNDLVGELWKACADPLMCVPTCGEMVYYFPRVHIDQLDNSTNLEVIDQVQISNLPPKVICRVINVQLLANHETDEAYAEVALLPEQDQAEAETVDILPAEASRPQFHSFSKVLTASDTKSNWGLGVPWRDAVNCFPPLDTTEEQPSQELIAKDIHGIEWRFKHVFRGNRPRHLLTKGWKQFVTSKRLVSGDSVVFIRGENGELRVGVRHHVHQESYGGECSQNKQVAAAVASHALLTRALFIIRYEARTSRCIISLSKYLQSGNVSSRLGVYYEGEGYHQRSEGSDEQMEEVDGADYSLPQPTTISSEDDWEGLDDILCISPAEDPLELDRGGGTGENGEGDNNLANPDFEESEEQREDPPLVLQQPVEESTMRAIPIAIPTQIPYGGPGSGDEKIRWEGYLVAQWCVPTLNRVISRYPDSLSGFKARSDAFKSMCLEILAEVVYLFEHFTVESLGKSRDEFNMAKQFIWDLKLSGIEVDWVEARLVQIDEALKMQSLIQQRKELEDEIGSVNKQLEELSSKVGPNHPAANKPILDGLL